MTIDLRSLRPRPTKVVANMPYGIAAGGLLRTIEELDSVRSWVAMVQREVGERLAASPGSGAYGTPSVLAQLACEVEVVRAIPRTVFHPVPSVDSVLVGLRRRPPGPGGADGSDGSGGSGSDGSGGSNPSPALRALVAGAFAHRRKTLAGSLTLSGRAPGLSRERIREALGQLGHPTDVRAERLSPEDFRALARLLDL
jgi:16S rRNA (adenine1518-N6/adenine1519-N6)-dimethyltransferase